MKLRRPAVWFAIGVVGTIVLAVAVAIALLRTGDPKALSDNAPLIAAVVALGGVVTAQMVSIALEHSRAQEARNSEDRRTIEALQLEDQRAHESRELETERANEAALRNYFKDVGALLIEKPLRRTRPGDNLSTVVRAQTLSVLEGLDPRRKRILLLFLYESGLIDKRKPVVSLVAANLSGANLRGAYLNEAWLSEADLSEANLSKANLNGTDLREVKDLSGTDLRKADLEGAHLSKKSLYGADLREAWLSGADLRGANLEGADLEGADLNEAKLGEAQLKKANLNGAGLLMADLAHARNLGEATLRGANLQGANLRGTTPGGYNKDLTQQQLEEADGNSMGGPDDPKTLLPPGLYPPKHWEKFPD